MVKKQSSAKGV